jgi:ribokinase
MTPFIAVLGSLHLDIVVRAPRLPLLGETLMGHAHHQQAGGKGLNQAVACARAGVPTRMLGAVGNDEFGDTLTEHLVAEDVDVGNVLTLPGQASGMSVAILEGGGDYAAVVVSGANAQLTAATVATWEPTLRESAALVLQNEVPVQVNVAAAWLMSSLGRLVVLNAAPARELSADDLAGVSLLVVNAVEAEMMGAQAVVDLASAEQAAKALVQRLGATVVATAGPHGAAWAQPDGSSGAVACEPVKVVSTLGAGDAFIGHLVAGLVRGSELGSAVRAANQAAARHISGAATSSDRTL